jgi:hypothetical protein
MSKKSLCVVSAFLILLAACGKAEEPKTAPPAPVVSEPAPAPAPAGVSAGTVALGKAIGPDKKVTTPGESFAKGDTIYVTIDTTGTGPAVLKAKWTFQKGGQTTVVKEDTQTIMPTGPATSEFHISKPDGWPPGDYMVEVTVDDKPVAVKHFTVK